MPAELVDALVAFPLFAAVPREQLAWFVAGSEVRELAPGERLINPGSAIEHTHVVLRGCICIFDPQQPAQNILLLPAGSVSGYLPFSRLTTARAVAEASEATTVLAFPKARTQELVSQCFELTQALVSVMTSRVRETTAQQQQNERMMALGKLSAGLAHELNNPIGAIASTVEALGRHARALPEAVTGLLADAAGAPAAATALFVPQAGQAPLSRLAQAALEDDLLDWLEDHDVPDAGPLAEALAESGAAPAALEALARLAPAPRLGGLLHWAYHQRQIQRLADETREAAGRVTQLIKSVKIYTHMDQAPSLEPADLHAGLRNTLTMLGHKVRQGQVELTEDFAADLPPVNLFVGEINQVWTNLLDNALDALKGVPDAALRISTRRDRDFALVTITDNGPGIPPEVQPRIFDPFFTTKAPGQGTGLGLDVVQRIVRQHRGAIKVSSEPGRTAFEVCLPIQ